MNLNLVVAEEAPAIADHENILLNQIENKLERGLCKDYKKCPKKTKNRLLSKCDNIDITNDMSKWKY